MKENLKNNETYDDLIIRYLDGYASAEEKKLLEEWIEVSDENKKSFETLKKIWIGAGDAGILQQLDIENDWQKVASSLPKEKESVIIQIRATGLSRKFRLVSIAAGFLLLILASVAIFYITRENAPFQEYTLSDGTQVWVQQGSQMEYPDFFEGNTRRVKLRGQAFFDVAANQEKPFVVELDNTVIEVLGTSFNVQSRQQQTTVTVATGTVRFTAKNDSSNFVLLTQAEKGVYKNDLLTERSNDNPNYIAWKTGVFSFDGVTIEAVVAQLSEYYPETFKLASGFQSDCLLSARFNKEKPKTIARVLQNSCSLQVQKSNKGYLISN